MLSKIKKIFIYSLDKWFDIIASGGSVYTTWQTFRSCLPNMNGAIVWLICWAVGLATIILLPLRYRFKIKIDDKFPETNFKVILRHTNTGATPEIMLLMQHRKKS